MVEKFYNFSEKVTYIFSDAKLKELLELLKKKGIIQEPVQVNFRYQPGAKHMFIFETASTVEGLELRVKFALSEKGQEMGAKEIDKVIKSWIKRQLRIKEKELNVTQLNLFQSN